MSLVHYNTPHIADAAQQLQQAYVHTDQNHQQALQHVHNNAENFGGRGSDQFQQTIAMVNSQYAAHKETILRAHQALGLANDGMTETDGQMAAQYT